MANGRAATISIAQLSSAVNQAVKTAQTKHNLNLEGTNIQFLPNWQILGRVLREALLEDFGEAQQFANDVAEAANHVSAGGGAAASAGVTTPKFQPAIVWDGRHIICGIWPSPEVILSE
jgi:hypothetical protein